MTSSSIAGGLAVGAAAGLLSGLLGVGGGIVLVPLLVMALGFAQHNAHATSLAAIVPIAAVGAVTFGFEGNVDGWVAALLAAGTLVGAPLGARIMARISEARLKLAFALLTVAIGIQLMWP